ncbi:MAG: hypothetical protein DGJ47_000294 [Rickettsiaceae bacterium]
MSKVVLSLKNICKDYRQGRSTISVLDRVNLDLCEGEMLAVIGSSGKGKSTLLHIAGLLDKPNQGSVEMSGYKGNLINQIKSSHLIRLQHLGFIYQYHHLQRDFTAQENVAMPLLIAGINRREAYDRSESLLCDLGLAKRILNVPGELSGGEQQRVAIARALINNPKIILADEPTGNLDPSTADEVFDILLSHVQKRNASVIMVSHNMELASRMHRIVEL